MAFELSMTDSNELNLQEATFLTRPSNEKTTIQEEDDNYVVAMTSMQGWRKNMEDVSVLWLKIPNDSTNTMYCGIFDGHGGRSVAEFAGTFLLTSIMGQREWTSDLKEAIKKGYIECDLQLKAENNEMHTFSGSTALTVFIRGNQLFCGNVGDSRAIGCDGDKVVKLSFDHKPTVPAERERIVSSGGHVFMERINGSLGLSRALGDFAYKKEKTPPEQQIVSPVPEVIQKTVEKTWEFLVLACDGVWEVLNDESVQRFVRAKLQNHPPSVAAETLVDQCLSPTCNLYAVGCDNMSAIIVKFKKYWNTSVLCGRSADNDGSFTRIFSVQNGIPWYFSGRPWIAPYSQGFPRTP